MFIGVVGLEGTGRHLVVDILVRKFKYRYIKVECDLCLDESGVANKFHDHLCIDGRGGNKNRDSDADVGRKKVSDENATGSITNVYNVRCADANECDAVDPDGCMSSFSSTQRLIEYVTLNYKGSFVTIIDNEKFEDEIRTYSERPFYCTLAVDASFLVRLGRMNAEFFSRDDIPSLLSDVELFTKLAKGTTSCHFKLADYTIVNRGGDSLRELEDGLSKATKVLAQKARPNWDSYFMQLAHLTAQRSNCMKRRVGAVLITRQSHRIISTGYNGTPFRLKNCNDGGCPRCNANMGGGLALATCICLHAEENALLEAGRERISLYQTAVHSGKDGVALYCTTCPCISCAKKIIQTGVKEVVYSQAYHMDDVVRVLLEDAEITVRQI